MPKPLLVGAEIRRAVGLVLLSLFALFALVAPTSASAWYTERVAPLEEATQLSAWPESVALSADGRFIAFSSEALSLVTPGSSDVFVHDRLSGSTERVSVALDGGQANGSSYAVTISADGRFVAFSSHASNLAAGDTNNFSDVFVRDRLTGITERMSVAVDGGGQANASSFSVALSADGRFVAFDSHASNLVAGDTNNEDDVFVRDRLTGRTERVSVGVGGLQGNRHSGEPVISADGRVVAFRSFASNLVAGDTNGATDVFVRDRVSGSTERVNVGPGATEHSLSADGRLVAFNAAGTLVSGVFVYDRQAGTTEHVSEGGAPELSADGRFVAFSGPYSNLVPSDTNRRSDVFVRDRRDGSTERVSVASGGAQANHTSGGPLALSADGRLVAFRSVASDLVAGDTVGSYDLFVHDRQPGCTIVGTERPEVIHGTPDDDVICGLDGMDQLYGEGGHDVLRGGGSGDFLYGGTGRDLLDGGDHNDRLQGGSGADVFSGGDGMGDHVRYWGQRKPVTVTIGDGANDGTAGERDDVQADIEWLSGGKGDDTLTGSSGNDLIHGYGGNDRLAGGAGGDRLRGDGGDDTIDAADGFYDRVTCGEGLDSVLSDPFDTLFRSFDCENLL